MTPYILIFFACVLAVGFGWVYAEGLKYFGVGRWSHCDRFLIGLCQVGIGGILLFIATGDAGMANWLTGMALASYCLRSFMQMCVRQHDEELARMFTVAPQALLEDLRV